MFAKITLFVLVVIFLLGSTAAMADQNYLSVPEQPPAPVDTSRANRGEIFGEGLYSFHGTNTGSATGETIVVDVHPHGEGGIGVGYNIGRHVNVNVDVTTGPAKYYENIETEGGNNLLYPHDGWMTRAMGNIEFYPLKGPITPLVTIGLGWLRTSGSLPGSRILETDIAYDAGAGVRWDLNSNVFVKAIYKANWAQFRHTQDYLLLNSLYFQIGFEF